jgi:hypothetical protein
LAFHVNVAPHTVLDHNTRTPEMTLTQFMQKLLFFLSRNRQDGQNNNLENQRGGREKDVGVADY